MSQAIQISQTKFDELLIRMSRLEAMVARLLERSNAPDIPFVDEETERLIGQGLEDYKAGRYTVLHSAEEIEKHLDSL